MIEMDDKYNSIENFNLLVEKEHIRQCPVCGEYSAYAYMDVNMVDGRRMVNNDGLSDGNEPYTDNEILTNWPDVYSIGACGGLGEWQCGHCKNYLVAEDSPLNHPCYTHNDYE